MLAAAEVAVQASALISQQPIARLSVCMGINAALTIKQKLLPAYFLGQYCQEASHLLGVPDEMNQQPSQAPGAITTNIVQRPTVTWFRLKLG